MTDDFLIEVDTDADVGVTLPPLWDPARGPALVRSPGSQVTVRAPGGVVLARIIGHATARLRFAPERDGLEGEQAGHWWLDEVDPVYASGPNRVERVERVDPSCTLCGGPMGESPDCRNCANFVRALEAMRRPALPGATYVHVLERTRTTNSDDDSEPRATGAAAVRLGRRSIATLADVFPDNVTVKEAPIPMTTTDPTTPATPLLNARELYDVYLVRIRLIDKLCGGTPRNPELLRGWIAATTKHDDATTDAQEREAREALLAPTEEKSWNGFPGDEVGLFVWARQVKALFKECASMLRITTQKLGSKQILQHGFEVKGLQKYDRVYLGKTAPDGFDEGPIHVQTPQGPRTAIKRVDYVEGVELEFEVWVLDTHPTEKRHVGKGEMTLMATFGQENGLGADRSQGRGKFEVIKFDFVQKGRGVGQEPKAEAEPKAPKGGKRGKAAPAEPPKGEAAE